jgi:hypothetical protein
MSRIYIIDAERRDWGKRLDQSRGSVPVTRRYVMIVEDPRLREAVRTSFSDSPHAVHPHESGNPSIFYCIVGPSCRRPKQLVEALHYKLSKYPVEPARMQGLEILVAG